MFKKKVNLILLILTVFILAACSQQPAKTEDQYMSEAKAKYDAKQFDEAIAIYKEMLQKYPKSPKAIDAYNQIAGIYITEFKNYDGAITTYKDMAAAFPETKEGKHALFMVAFTYDEHMKQKDKAIVSYKEFLQKYPQDKDPNDKLSESAKIMLQTLESGTSIEDLINSKINESAGENKTPPTDTVNQQLKLKDDAKKDVNKDTKVKEVKPNDTDSDQKK